MPATKLLLEKLLGDFAVAVIHMADKPSAESDAKLKEAIKKLAAGAAVED